MSQPSKKTTPSGIAESQGYACIKFCLEKPNGSFAFHEADCLIKAVVAGLKEDLQHELGPPEAQRWFYENQLIADDGKLMDYGINGCDETRIIVKKSSN